MKRANIVYSLSVMEYLLMVSLTGSKQTFGPVGTLRVNQELVLDTLQKLTHQGALVSRDTGFELCEPYRGLFDAISRAESVRIVHSGQPGHLWKSDRYCYQGEELWCVAASSCHRDRLLCVQIESGDLVDYFEEEEMLPAELRRSVPFPEEKDSFPGREERAEELPVVIPMEEDEVDWTFCTLIVERMTQTGERIARTGILWSGGRLLLVQEKEGETKAWRYDKAFLRKLLED